MSDGPTKVISTQWPFLEKEMDFANVIKYLEMNEIILDYLNEP